MELDTITAPAGNEQRHGHIIAAWKLAQSSPHTLRAYSRSMADYCGWLDSRGIDLLTVKRPIIDGYRHAVAGSPATVAAKLVALSSFYRYALSADVIGGGNPVELVKRPKVDPDHSSTEGLSKDQAKALLAAARADGSRSHALVSLLLFTGIRLSEALNASTTNYGHGTGHRTLSIRCKGGKDGKVAVPAAAVEALNAYLGRTGHELLAGAAGGGLPIFTTATGKRWNPAEAFRSVQRLARAAGLGGRSVPTRCGTPLSPSLWTRGPPCTTSRTARDMLTPAPAGTTGRGTRLKSRQAMTSQEH